MVSDIQLYRAFIVKNTRTPVIAIHDVGMKALPLLVGHSMPSFRLVLRLMSFFDVSVTKSSTSPSHPERDLLAHMEYSVTFWQTLSVLSLSGRVSKIF